MEQRWNDTDRGMRDVLGEKPVPVPLCPPQAHTGRPGTETTHLWSEVGVLTCQP